jgi:hypothetical protein
MNTDITHIELIHPNGERQTLPVELITKTYISVRWGMNGTYDLNLLKNVLTARSAKTRRRNKCLWRYVNIVALRERVNIHFDKEYEKNQQDIRDHNASMPGLKSTSG